MKCVQVVFIVAIYVYVVPKRVAILRVLILGLRCIIWIMFSSSFTFRWHPHSDIIWTLRSVPLLCNLLKILKKHSPIRNSACRKASMIFFNSSRDYHRRSRKHTGSKHTTYSACEYAAFLTMLLQRYSQYWLLYCNIVNT